MGGLRTPAPEGAEDERAVRLGVDLELTEDAASDDDDEETGAEPEVVDEPFESGGAAAPPIFLPLSCSGSGRKVEHPKLSEGVCFGLRLAMVAKTWNRSSRRTLPRPPAELLPMTKPNCRAISCA